jgi:hypothetical protein
MASMADMAIMASMASRRRQMSPKPLQSNCLILIILL